ncbi:MAG: glycosyltransferase [Planctomycetes bacterium]|nr:glycosyltransferase [Planctomycetota bacterium]
MSRTTFAIPCRNGAAHLPALLASLRAQSRPAAAIVLVDDASTDDSVALARRHGGDDITVLVNDRALGMAANWNRCAELVRTEFFCLAHMDDVYRPGYLATMEDVLATRPEAAFVHCRAAVLDEHDREVASPIEEYKDRFWKKYDLPPTRGSFAWLWEGNYVICPSVLYKTATFRELGAFDTSLSFAPDWDFWLRTLLCGHTIAGVPERLIAYRRHPRSTTRTQAQNGNRYLEELTVSQRAAEQAAARGWMPSPPPPSPAVRRNVLVDAFADLDHHAPAAAAAKIALLRAHAPTLARHVSVLGFRCLSHLGGPGRACLRAGMRWVARRSHA